MKLFSKYFLALVAAGLLFTACDDDDDFSAGKPTAADCPALTFGADNSFSLELDPDDPSDRFDVPIYRNNATNAATYNINVLENTDSVYNVPATVSFGDGETESSITVTYSGMEVGPQYKLAISFDDDDVDAYSEDTYNVFTYSVTYVKWDVLGMATFHDDFFFYESYEVELQQNGIDPTLFRMLDPYSEGLVKEGYVNDGEAPSGTYLTFRVLQVGETLNSTEITTTGLVYFDPYDTGYYYASYASELWIYHPSAFTSYQTESSWSYSKVVSYASDGVTPAIVQFAPMYYLPDYGGYWNYSSYNNMVTIVFPGTVIADYSVEINYQGVNDNAEAVANITLGADVATARVAVVEGKDASAALDAVMNGTVDYTEVTSSGTATLPFDGSGDFTLIAVSYDASGDAQEYDYSYFEYYEDGASPWVSLGMCTYTDDFFTTFWAVDPETWEVEIEENTDNPGLYRLVYPYDEKYVWNDPGDWDPSSTYYMEINACDPDGVYLTAQEIGVDWNYGMISVNSMAAYYMSRGYNFDEVKDAGYCGTLVNGVITFPENALLIGMADYYDGGWFTANTNGAFKVVLPGASGVKAKKVSAARQLADKTVKATASPFTRGKMLRNAPISRNAKLMK